MAEEIDTQKPDSKAVAPTSAGSPLRPCPVPLSQLKGMNLQLFYAERRILPGPPRLVLYVIADDAEKPIWWDYMDTSATTVEMWLEWLHQANIQTQDAAK